MSVVMLIVCALGLLTTAAVHNVLGFIWCVVATVQALDAFFSSKRRF